MAKPCAALKMSPVTGACKIFAQERHKLQDKVKFVPVAGLPCSQLSFPGPEFTSVHALSQVSSVGLSHTPLQPANSILGK
eukprot:scaffold175652_cov15-Tisochrysis_lutea.AAC.1